MFYSKYPYIVPAIFPNALEIRSIIMGLPTAIKIAETIAATTVTSTYSRVDCPLLLNIFLPILQKILFTIFITPFSLKIFKFI